mmetsp:Transcript_110926/g.286780  ORF Transcript_110926/g.286780 Transcript_110926/m.286780 type:complete len:344 (+) Transcript_110926:391-1422(+)
MRWHSPSIALRCLHERVSRNLCCRAMQLVPSGTGTCPGRRRPIAHSTAPTQESTVAPNSVPRSHSDACRHAKSPRSQAVALLAVLVGSSRTWKCGTTSSTPLLRLATRYSRSMVGGRRCPAAKLGSHRADLCGSVGLPVVLGFHSPTQQCESCCRRGSAPIVRGRTRSRFLPRTCRSIGAPERSSSNGCWQTTMSQRIGAIGRTFPVSAGTRSSGTTRSSRRRSSMMRTQVTFASGSRSSRIAVLRSVSGHLHSWLVGRSRLSTRSSSWFMRTKNDSSAPASSVVLGHSTRATRKAPRVLGKEWRQAPRAHRRVRKVQPRARTTHPRAACSSAQIACSGLPCR